MKLNPIIAAVLVVATLWAIMPHTATAQNYAGGLSGNGKGGVTGGSSSTGGSITTGLLNFRQDLIRGLTGSSATSGGGDINGGYRNFEERLAAAKRNSAKAVAKSRRAVIANQLVQENPTTAHKKLTAKQRRDLDKKLAKRAKK